MADVDILNPFTPEAKERILQGIQVAEDLIRGIEKANQAGIDTGTRLEDAKISRARLVRMKNVYFPNG